jgi:hypothetical protein
MAPLIRKPIAQMLSADLLIGVIVGELWDNLIVAKWEVKKAIIDASESWKIIKLDKERLILKYKDEKYLFRV